MSTSTDDSSEEVQAFVAGRLDPQAAARLRTQAEHNPHLAAEIALWTAIREQLAQGGAPAPADELGWARLERALAEREVQGSQAVANDNAAVAHRPFWRRHMIAPWQAAAGVAVAIMAWQLAVAPTLTPVPQQHQPGYELAGEEAEQAPMVRVAFAPDATESELRAVLRAARARIVDGPSAIGLYTVAFADAEAETRGIQLLAGHPDVVAEVAD